jgi:hypothetical protein
VTLRALARSRGVTRILPCLLGLLALAGCGAESEPTPGASARSTALMVTVDPDGTGPTPAKRARVDCPDDSCPAVPASAFEPVSRRRVCTDIFGGPETATIEGTLRGRAVSARFSRTNGCEIARWEAASPLLDRVAP